MNLFEGCFESIYAPCHPPWQLTSVKDPNTKIAPSSTAGTIPPIRVNQSRRGPRRGVRTKAKRQTIADNGPLGAADVRPVNIEPFQVRVRSWSSLARLATRTQVAGTLGRVPDRAERDAAAPACSASIGIRQGAW